MRNRILLAALLIRLVSVGQIPDFKPSTPLLDAVPKSDTQVANKLLDEGANPNEGRFLDFPRSRWRSSTRTSLSFGLC